LVSEPILSNSFSRAEILSSWLRSVVSQALILFSRFDKASLEAKRDWSWLTSMLLPSGIFIGSDYNTYGYGTG